MSFEVRRGEVHALLGHNGSGKSTLVKIISGYQRADSGRVDAASGQEAHPRIGIVHQDLGLCLPATVVENCGMGSFRRRLGMIDWGQERAATARVLEQLGADIGLDDIVADLPPADRAITAIARALKATGGVDEVDLLILDEATAALRGPDAEKVLSAARSVTAHGGAVLLVTHHMSEVTQVADRATVLVSGQVVDTVDVAGTTEEKLLTIIGGGRKPTALERRDDGGAAASAREVLTVKGLTGGAAFDMSFAVRAGEIVGLTGAAGAGQDDVPYLLCGATPHTGGQVWLESQPYTGRGAREAQRSGLGILPSDRLRKGMALSATVRENLSPTSRRQHLRGGLLREGSEKAWAREVCAEYNVLPADPELPMAALSGGNQQKVIFARVLEHQPKVLVLHDPTQGVDANTRRALMNRVRTLVDQGLAVLYVSSDTEEVAECADRVLVMRRGSLVAEVPGGVNHLDEVHAAAYSAGTGSTDRADGASS
ncbi:sugar ABC transporter ATP-binding protein [Ornithinimicrobium sufpigmenti]|uniref:sugar ABC transporter ATP-binding protein n=1 Tax=Ornithinimicrobium sufpigmenti TaxID=2508882 RepID=UPI00192D9682|nr:MULTISPECIES: sugar ABC transporter ATP-binding protein [unclassified Ornithinimicrobium]